MTLNKRSDQLLKLNALYELISLHCVGLHLIEVFYNDVAVPKSPFRVSVVEGCDPTRVRAYGPGLEGGLVNKPNCFTVETRYRLIINIVLNVCVSERKLPCLV